jgi:hypothetical protein
LLLLLLLEQQLGCTIHSTIHTTSSSTSSTSSLRSCWALLLG